MADDDSTPHERRRLGDRSLSDRVTGLEYRTRDLGRGLGELRDEVRHIREVVDGMTEAEKIATAVTAALRADRHRWFGSFPRRVLAALASGLLLIPAVHDLAGWIAS